jgi:hypothetical protein
VAVAGTAAAAVAVVAARNNLANIAAISLARPPVPRP